MNKLNHLLLFLLLSLLASLGLAQTAPAARVNAAVAQLDGLAQQTLEKTGIPGMAVAVVHQDKVVYLKGFGVREVGKPEGVNPDTVFQIASLSKPIASTLVAALVGDGVVGWDDRIADLDPGFQLSDPAATQQVTLRDLFSHRSGLPEFAGDLLEDMGYGRAEILRRLRLLPLSSPRSRYAYTNFGLTEAAVAAAKKAGGAWEDLIAQRLYKPLGMASTSSRVADYRAAKNRALLHAKVGGKFVAKYQRNPDPESPAGGVSSTARDLAQWARLHLGGGKFGSKQLISAEALTETYRPHMVSSPTADPATGRSGFYGLGWDVDYDAAGRVVLSHSGAFGLGAATNVRLIPAEGLGIVVLTNGAPVGAPEAVAVSFMELALGGKVSRDWVAAYGGAFEALTAALWPFAPRYAQPPAQPLAALPLSSYAGRYANAFYGELEVALRGGGLVALLGPNKTAYPLRHWSRDLFTISPEEETFSGTSGVFFQVGSDGRVGGVRLEVLDRDGLGNFTRVSAGP
jgi:CubicO group peptidase (beta-lactamase class C family)